MHQLRAFIAVVKTSLYGRNPNVLHLEGLEASLLNVQVRLKHKKWGTGKSTALLYAFRNRLFAFSVLPAGREGAESGRKAVSPLTFAESRAIGLP